MQNMLNHKLLPIIRITFNLILLVDNSWKTNFFFTHLHTLYTLCRDSEQCGIMLLIDAVATFIQET